MEFNGKIQLQAVLICLGSAFVFSHSVAGPKLESLHQTAAKVLESLHGKRELPSPEIKVYSENWIDGERVRLRFGDRFEFSFQINGEILISYIDYEIAERESLKTVDQNEIDASWSEAEAVDVALEFLKQINLGDGVELGKGTAEWIVNERRPGVFLKPYWMITFPRIHADGIRYYDDSVVIQTSEEFGSYALKSSALTVVDPKHIAKSSERIPKEKAIRLAKKFVDLTLGKDSLSGVLPSGVLHPNETPSFSELCIVRPNNFLEANGIGDIRSERVGKLAWVFWFPCWRESDLERTSDPVSSVSVWIDTVDGTYCGGDLITF